MILDAFKFTNILFLNNFVKFLTVLFPVYVINYLVYLQISSIPGNEFGTTTGFNYQDVIINVLNLYSFILIILLIDDIYKERNRSITNYFYIAAYLFIKIAVINLITAFVVILGLFGLILPGLYFSARLAFASYFAIMFDDGIIKSLKKSIEVTQDNGWNVLGFLLSATVPLLCIMIFILIGPALLLMEDNMNAYMAISYFVTYLFMIYITIYCYRLLNNLMEISNESI